jgi:hypothetical protein
MDRQRPGAALLLRFGCAPRRPGSPATGALIPKARLRFAARRLAAGDHDKDAFEPKRAALQRLSYRFLEARGALHETILDD